MEQERATAARRASFFPRSLRASAWRFAVPVLALLALAHACAGPRSSDAPPPPEIEAETPSPDWRYSPLSWEKLGSIEQWLDSDAAEDDPGMRIEAALQLAEGRMVFARQDLETGTAPPETIRLRIESARDGFLGLIDEPEATPGQRTRAQIGMQGAIALLEAPTESGLALVTRPRWQALASNPAKMTRLKGAWSRITIHHSVDSISDGGSGTIADSVEAVRGIQRFHMQDPRHMWGDIGYHFLIDSAGHIFEGRELVWQGAHAGGAGGVNNNQNLGVCLLGDFSYSRPTNEALKSLELLLETLRDRYRIPRSRVYAHREFGDTVCPGDALVGWLQEFRQ